MIRRRVGISLLAYSPDRLAGQGTYTIGITRALLSRGVHDYIVMVPSRYEDLWREALPSGAEFVTCAPNPADLAERVWYEQRHIPGVSRRYGIDTVFFPHMFAPLWRVPCAVVTVHDLLLLSQRTDFAWHKRLYLYWSYARLRFGGSHIATVSEFCRSDISTKLRVDPKRICVVYNGLDQEFLDPALRDSQRQDHVEEPYLLSVAAAYPHKRFDILLAAFSRVAGERPDLQLVLAGTYAGRPDAIARLHVQVNDSSLRSRIRILPRLPRRELPQLYAKATALVSSSEFEGFGIPVLEAMAVECPVAATPAKAVVEVLGGCGWLAEDFSAEALAAAMRQAIRARSADSGRLIEARNRALTTFNWERSAAVLERVFESLAQRR